MDKLRVREYETFASIGMERAKSAKEDAYVRINKEKELIKERLAKAGGTTKALFHDLFASEEASDEELSDEDFYNNASDQEEEPGGKIPGSIPGKPVKTGQIADVMNSSTSSIGSAMRATSRDSKDFRIKSQTSDKTSATRQQQAKRTHVMGLSKPHQLASQNDQIKRMLGMATSEPHTEPKKVKKNPLYDTSDT